MDLHNPPQDPYAQRGVSSGKEALHQVISQYDAGLYPRAFCKVLPDWLTGSDAHALMIHTDTAGTKPIAAYLQWAETGALSVWHGIAQDALVMNTDDLAAAGVVDRMVFSSNIARNARRIPMEVVASLIEGAEAFARKLKDFDIHLLPGGGETADVGDLVRTIDVGYTLTARIPRSEVIENRFEAGDVIVGLASSGQAAYESHWNSGIGCNGLTSARHDLLNHTYASQYPETYEHTLPKEVVYAGSYALADHPTELGQPIGEALLSPTRTYLPVLREVFARFRSQVHGVIHCTGGGQTKCMKFNPDLHIIKDNLFPVPPVFTLIQQTLPTPPRVMYQTFNMGHRMELYVPESIAEAIIQISQACGVEARVIGRCEQRAEGPQLTIQHGGEQYIYS